MKPSVCLNMIVKNEGERLARCLNSVLPYVKTAVICDTGSTDDTKDVIKRVTMAHDVPCAIAEAPFENFSQARNAAWAAAKLANGTAVPWCQFALLMDADMELVADNKHVFKKLDAKAFAYDMMQKGGSVSYVNRRVISLEWPKAPYVGVTHEYINIPSSGILDDVRFIDHADGSNRKEKYVRDIALLVEDLKSDPNNARSWFYLGNSYKDAGMHFDAIQAYQRRIDVGGWDEEIHAAMMSQAQCELAMGATQRYVAGMVAAYNFRPRRAEPLYELAKYFREKGDNAASLLFSKQAMRMTRPDDLLFVDDFVYEHGARFEFSVAGSYDDRERKAAFQVTDDLALDLKCPAQYRWAARNNLFWHTKPLKDYCPSFEGHQLAFVPPAGYTAMNPSIEVCNGAIRCNVRTVNYKIDEHGRYMIGEKGCQEAPIDTRNFVCTLADNFDVETYREILWHRPPASFPLVTGLEDVRLWRYCGELMFTATVREQLASGVPQMVQGKLVHDIDPGYMLVKDWKSLSDGKECEKNWMPMPSVPFGHPRFMYRLDKIITPSDRHPMKKTPTGAYVGDISGSSQLLPFRHGYIAVVHEAITGPDGKRTYWHRFVWWTMDGELKRISLPFVFYDRQIEFCAGLAFHPNLKDFAISFGVRDAEAHVATVNIEEVATMLWHFHES